MKTKTWTEDGKTYTCEFRCDHLRGFGFLLTPRFNTPDGSIYYSYAKFQKISRLSHLQDWALEQVLDHMGPHQQINAWEDILEAE